MVSATRLTKAEEVSCSSALFIRCRARTTRSACPLCHRTWIPKSVRSTVRHYVFERTFGRVRDAHEE
jgi:hypothetical protein